MYRHNTLTRKKVRLGSFATVGALISYSLGSVITQSGLAIAQPVPGAGSILNQLEILQPKTVKPQTLPPTSEKESMPSEAGMSIRVVEFRFTGNQKMTDQQLTAGLAPFLGRSLSFRDLRAAAAQVAAMYAENGWVVRAYLPEQDITAGTVTISVIEAKFGEVVFQQGEPASMTHQRLEEMAASVLRRGEPVSAPALERLLLTFGDIPGVAVSGSLVPGPGEGETSLRLNAQDRAQVNGSLMVDNNGSRAIGPIRAIASLNWNSPSRKGDQLSLLGVATEGSRYGRLAYSWPANLRGARWSVAMSSMDYMLTASEFAALNAKGSAYTHGLEYTTPLIRSMRSHLRLNIGFEDKAFRNFSGESIVSDYWIRNVSAGISGEKIDSEGGQWGFSASTIRGRRSPDASSNAAPEDGANYFNKWRISFSRVEPINANTYLLVSLSSQYAKKNLDGSEKFFLGGPAGIRGFPAGEGGGNSGAIINVQWHNRWLPRTDAGVFVSAGTVKSRSIEAMPTEKERSSLSSAGIVLQWDGPWGTMLKGIWSRRLRPNPNANAAGQDQDGSTVRDRLWLNASWAF